ncbi:MAG: UDP-glucose 4-epimerase GalE [Saccharofermentanales bacterium]|jgi:UDP-glucose 4-epimerase|nr:UDP-glucose 4-epimerase GalE [Bacillota bacterium]NLB09347.1 UDP-glucose 4-epimerase GalE [Clostridiales bacterium]
MNILVTGGTGYIGSHTVVELLNRGEQVVIVDNLSNSYDNVIDRIESICGRHPDFVKADVRDFKKMEAVFAQYDFDAVIHFAGSKAVGESVAKPLLYYRNNLESTWVLVELMKKYNVPSIIFSSSATVYGETDLVPIKEDTEYRCTNPYGRTKMINELFLQDIVAAHPGISAICLRYFNPIGAHASGLIGEDPQGIPNNLMPYITQVAIGKLKMLSVFGNDYPTHDGTGVRDYIHVVDLAKGHLAAVDYVRQNQASGFLAVNLGTGRGYSVLDLVHTFSRVSGKDIPYQLTERRPGDIATCYADPSKAKELFCWETKLDLQKMCEDSWRWQSKNPTGYKR